MEIRCGNVAKWEFVLFCLAVSVAALFYRDIRALALIGGFLLFLPYFLYRFRRFRLDNAGVEVTYLGCFRKYYLWDSFVVKQMVQPLYNLGIDPSKRRRGLSQPRHRNPVLLSYKPILVPSCINYGYAFWHPLSCVFIGFDDEFPKYKNERINREQRSLRDFEVNREEFISKMNEWGVEIKGLNDQQ